MPSAPSPSSPTATATPWDVVVCGAGPAGSSTAALLADHGHRVLLVERETFPRFHIGESLLPVSNPILDRIGLDRDQLAKTFVTKHGATFLSEDDQRESRIEFAVAPGIEQPASFHVERAPFDQLLLENARTKGVEAHTACSVAAVDLDGERARLELEDADGRTHIEARFVVDATGRHGLLSRKLGLRVMDQELRRAALFGVVKGLPRPEGRPGGDIRVILRPGTGWVWMIPFADGTTSVGFVCESEAIEGRDRGAPEECFHAWLAELPYFQEHLADLELVSPARWESDFSYSTRSYAGRNWALVGDAGAFLDPIFSTGLHLAFQGAEEVADAIHAALTVGRGAGNRPLAKYGKIQQRRYRFWRRLVRKFYHPGFQELFYRPDVWPAGTRALAAALGGDDRPGLADRLRLEALYLIARFQTAPPAPE